MATADPTPEPSPRPTSPRHLGRTVGIIVGALLLGALGFALTRQTAPAPPPSIAQDPVLARGFEIYALRCATCHGEKAKGDGPTAAKLAGPRPRDLALEDWKYGDTASAALASIANGCPGSAMPAYKGLYGEPDLKAVTAYTLHLAERTVPRSLRVP